MEFDLTQPTGWQLRDSAAIGLIAESIIVPIVVTTTVIDHRTVRWLDLAAALACIFVAVVFVAMFVVITNGKSTARAQTNVLFAIACLAITGLAFIELASANPFGIYTPAMLIGVVFACIIGDLRKQVAADVYVLALITWIYWVEGLRGADLLTGFVIYASTVAIINLICARTVGPMAGRGETQRHLSELESALGEFELMGGSAGTRSLEAMIGHGLSHVAELVPAKRVALFVHNRASESFDPLTEWPSEDPGRVGEIAEAVLAGRPGAPRLVEMLEVVRTQSTFMNKDVCIIPAGYSRNGELLLVVERTRSDTRADGRYAEAADQVASTFLRATCGALFASGIALEVRTDPLTGLANRRGLMERIDVEMTRALRSDSSLSLAMIDLDFFNDYNLRFGYAAGDTVLRSIAAVMVSNIRDQDLVARYGGEEFCLIMPDTDIVGGYHLLETLRCGGREATSDLAVTLSAGLTSWDGFESVSSLIERADQALRRAKESGRNRVVSIQAYTEF